MEPAQDTSRAPRPSQPPLLAGWLMAFGALVALTGLFAVALDLWPSLTGGSKTRIVLRIGADGAPELIVHRDRGGQYLAPGTVNGVDVTFLLDIGATDVGIPPALARQLKLRRGSEVGITTASDIIPGDLIILDEVSVGPLTLKRVRGSVSEHSIHGEVLLGMSFLRHFDLSQRGHSPHAARASPPVTSNSEVARGSCSSYNRPTRAEESSWEPADGRGKPSGRGAGDPIDEDSRRAGPRDRRSRKLGEPDEAAREMKCG